MYDYMRHLLRTPENGPRIAVGAMREMGAVRPGCTGAARAAWRDAVLHESQRAMMPMESNGHA